MKKMLIIALICCMVLTVVSMPVFADIEDFGRDFYTDFEDFGESVSNSYYTIENLETGTDETSLFHFNNNNGTASIGKAEYTGHGAAAKITVPKDDATAQVNFYSKNTQKSAVYGMSIYVPEGANTLSLNSQGHYNNTDDWNYGFKNLVCIDGQKMTVLKNNTSLLTDELQPGWYDIRFGFDFEKKGIKGDQRVYFYITLPDGTQKITNAGMAGMVGNSSHIIGDLKRFQLGITSSTTADGTYGLDDMSIAYMKDMVVSHDVTDVAGKNEVTISFNQDIYLPGGVDESSFITFYRGEEEMTGVTITPVKRAGFIRGAKITFANSLEAKYNYSYTVASGITDLFGRRFGNEFTNTFTLNTGDNFTSVTGITASLQDSTFNIDADVYHASSTKDIKIIAALYKGNQLVKFQINDVTLAYSKGKTVEVPVAFTDLPSDIGSDASYNVRCFIWNDLDNLTPIDGGYERWDNVGSAS